MMDLPIRLSFFKKLDLFQTMKAENKKWLNRKGESSLNVWLMEKEILSWANKQHHHIGSPLNDDTIKRELKKSNQFEDLSEYPYVADNLVVRGYAIRQSDGATLTNEGLLMGAVINDCKGRLGKFKYTFFIWLTWISIFLAFVLVILNIVEILLKLFCR